MRTGDLITVHHEGYNSGGETVTGLVISAMEDIDAFHSNDNYSRWLQLSMLVDGRQMTVTAYWDDFIEVHSAPTQR